MHNVWCLLTLATTLEDFTEFRHRLELSPELCEAEVIQLAEVHVDGCQWYMPGIGAFHPASSAVEIGALLGTLDFVTLA